jgi:rod shape-determining protein MreC
MLEFIVNFYYKFKKIIIFVILLNLSLLIVSFANEDFFGLRTSFFTAFAFLNNTFVTTDNYFNLLSENERLREINARLLLENTRLQEASRNALKYEKLLKLRDTSSFNLIPASVITKYYRPESVNIVLDKGSVDSVAVGMPVVNEDGLVGIVKQVSPYHCLVSTFYNIDLKITIKNARSGVDGILGYDGNKLIITNATNIFDMQYGDMLYTSDFSTLFPPKIPVGIVEKQNNKNNLRYSNYILMKPLVNIANVDKVFIIKFIKNIYLKNNSDNE